MSAHEELRSRLLALGFDAVRFASAEDLPSDGLRRWVEAGHFGAMEWMARSTEKRLQPKLVLEGAATLILLGVNYGVASASGEGAPRWARYSQYEDYHDTLKPALVEAGRVLEEKLALTSADYRYYVDTGPVLEREWSARAGLGFIGKNAMLISRDFGNWLFLAAILVRARLPADPPLAGGKPGVGALCGKCTRCLDACPTRAFVGPGWVDARRCISYLTIENKGAIPHEFRRAIGSRIYGCDICAEVCPWNRFAQDSRSILLKSRDGFLQLGLRELLTLDGPRFAEVFRRSPIKRIKLAGLLRNAAVVAANLRARDCVPELVNLASHESALVRAHAVWAVRELEPVAGMALLVGARAVETDPNVLVEYELVHPGAPEVF
ncbi:tRNA epoxyqueuosine(34) reductase QueG [Nibricoccus sp. IMCC34717]|uniref:tRNA epoxyqueuosine(34) reductase QueG n=1 Tax=Nibricoccus sp. IMCC34717 TaxID=3034021 RepID=UPI00384B6D46